jgi:hypothetical protein
MKRLAWRGSFHRASTKSILVLEKSYYQQVILKRFSAFVRRGDNLIDTNVKVFVSPPFNLLEFWRMVTVLSRKEISNYTLKDILTSILGKIGHIPSTDKPLPRKLARGLVYDLPIPTPVTRCEKKERKRKKSREHTS